MLEKYINEVLKVANAQNVDIDTAANKFAADVRAGKALYYNTNGDAGVDFAPIHEKFDTLGEDAQAAEIAALKDAVRNQVFPKKEAK